MKIKCVGKSKTMFLVEIESLIKNRVGIKHKLVMTTIKNYGGLEWKSSSYCNNTIPSKATKWISTLYNEKFRCGVEYETSVKTGKQTNISIWISMDGKSNVVMELKNQTLYEDAINILVGLTKRLKPIELPTKNKKVVGG